MVIRFEFMNILAQLSPIFLLLFCFYGSLDGWSLHAPPCMHAAYMECSQLLYNSPSPSAALAQNLNQLHLPTPCQLNYNPKSVIYYSC